MQAPAASDFEQVSSWLLDVSCHVTNSSGVRRCSVAASPEDAGVMTYSARKAGCIITAMAQFRNFRFRRGSRQKKPTLRSRPGLT